MVRKVMIAVFLLSVGFEVLLLAATLGDLRPRNSAAVAALFAYQNHPSKETHDRWEQELDKMNREVATKRIAGYSLLVANGLVFLYLGARLINRLRAADSTCVTLWHRPIKVLA